MRVTHFGCITKVQFDLVVTVTSVVIFFSKYIEILLYYYVNYHKSLWYSGCGYDLRTSHNRQFRYKKISKNILAPKNCGVHLQSSKSLGGYRFEFVWKSGKVVEYRQFQGIVVHNNSTVRIQFREGILLF